MRYIITAIMIMILPLAVYGEINNHAGEYGMVFLQNPTNPITLALANRGSYAQGNVDAFNINPAASVIDAHRSVAANHILWLEDTNYSNLSYSFSDRKSNTGLSLRALDYGKIERRLEDTGELIGYYQPVDLDINLNIGKRLSPNNYIGVNSGVVYEKLNTASAIGVSFDFGYIYLLPITGARLGTSFKHLGVTSKMDQERIKLPLTWDMDISKEISIRDNKVTLEATAIKAIDDNWKGSLNSEVSLSEKILLRLGYKINYDEQNLSAGIGLRFGKVQVDYGWSAFTNELNDIHALSIAYHFE